MSWRVVLDERFSVVAGYHRTDVGVITKFVD